MEKSIKAEPTLPENGDIIHYIKMEIIVTAENKAVLRHTLVVLH